MNTEQKIEQLEKDVSDLKAQLSALVGHIYANSYCRCTGNIITMNNICQGCGKPLMSSAPAQTGT